MAKQKLALLNEISNAFTPVWRNTAQYRGGQVIGNCQKDEIYYSDADKKWNNEVIK